MNYKKIRRTLGVLLLSAALAATALTGCGLGSDSADVSDTLAVDTDAENGNGSATQLHPDDMFSDRDREIGWDESSSVRITLADNASTCDSDAVDINDNTVTISEEGTYILSGSLSDGQILVDVQDTEKVQLVLDNADINGTSSAAIYVKQADKVFLTLADGSDNRLSTSGEFIDIDDNHIDAVLFSKDDLTLNGAGSLTVDSACGHGIVSKNDLRITSGTYTISAASSGLNGKDSVRILDGTFTLTAGKDGIHSENTDAGEEDQGFLFIAGGSFTIDSESDGLDASGVLQVEGGSFSIAAGDDGVHTDDALIINGGTFLITESYEGLEGTNITINGGDISLTATDDGINAAGGNDQSAFGPSTEQERFSGSDSSITIHGGTLNIDAGGDGIDSNGSLLVTGGETYVSGPTDNGNGALDYAGEAAVTGGILVAAGANGMACNFGETSTQGSILVNFPTALSAGDEIRLTDTEGNVLASFTPSKAYNSVVVSCPEIQKGAAYTLTAGDQSVSVEMETLIYGNGMGGFGGMGGHGGTGGFGGMGGHGGTDGFGGGGRDGIIPDENGEIPQRPDGEMPQMPSGEMPQRPDGEMPQMPDGEMPQMPSGEMPQMPDGEIPQMPSGETPQIPSM